MLFNGIQLNDLCSFVITVEKENPIIMSGNLKYCISLLQDNEESIRKEAQQVLVKLCTNIMKNPKEPRYRRIKLENAAISTKLLPALGAIECLFEAGFIEVTESIIGVCIVGMQ